MRYLNFAQRLSASINQKKDNLLTYLSLNELNSQLVEENTKLKNELEQFRKESGGKVPAILDSSAKQFSFIEAKVVNNSVNKQYNYITVNKGRLDGIVPDMAVISMNGIVGKVESVSDHFAMVISLLNRDLKVSAKFKKNNFYGSFVWSGINYEEASLNEIPLHVKVDKGDTIVTTGFTSTFPEGILLGYVENFTVKGGAFYDITLKISNDFKSLYYVYVITNYKKDEQQILESTMKYD